MPKVLKYICHLCGKSIECDATTKEMKKTDEHVPPLQFYPKKMREKIKGQLLTLPTHAGCNQSYKLDEEYFVHTYCPHVDKNSTSGRQLIEDIKRRSANEGQQSQKLLKMIQHEFSSITLCGIILPNGVTVHSVNAPRVDRVIRKILQGLYYYEEKKFLPHETPMWMQLYDDPNDMPNHFRKVFCETGPCRGIYPKIFSYRFNTIGRYSYWSMLFWDSLLFCIVFKLSL